MLSSSDSNSRDPLTHSLRHADSDSSRFDPIDSDAIQRLIRQLSSVEGPAPSIPISVDELRRVLDEPLQSGDLGSLDRYRILDFVGAGGMGIVFRGIDAVIERSVAIKVLRQELGSDRSAVRRFRREACAMSAVAHPFVATILEVGEVAGLPFFTMSWLPGQSLRQRMQCPEPLERSELLRIAAQITAGLTAAHRVSVLHRDIKPDNIWLCADEGEVRILDFGLARGLDANAAVSQTDALVGTPSYMAPEQIRGESIDERADLFALGCLLYHAAVGQTPFQGPHAIATLIRVTQDEPTHLETLRPDLGTDFAVLVRELMSKRPDERPASAQSVLERLKLMRDTSAVVSQPMPRPLASNRLRSLLPWLLALGFAAGFLFQIVQVGTNRGTLVIEADEQVAVEIENERVTLRDRTSGKMYELRVGDNPLPSGVYEIQFKERSSELEFSARQFAITRGSREPIRVSLIDAASQATPAIAQGSIPSSANGSTEQTASSNQTDGQPESNNTLSSNANTPDSQDANAPNQESQSSANATTWTFERSLLPTAAQGPSGERWTLESVSPRGEVTRLKLSSNGKRLASTGADGVIRIWDVETHSLVAMLAVTSHDFAWSPDGNYLAIAETWKTNETRLTIWDVRAEPRQVQESRFDTLAVRWSENGLLLEVGRVPGTRDLRGRFSRMDDGEVPEDLALSRFDLGENVFSREGDWLVVPDETGARLHHLKTPAMTLLISSSAVRPSFLLGTDLIALPEIETLSSPTGGTQREHSLKLYDISGNLVSRVLLWDPLIVVNEREQLIATPLSDSRSILIQLGDQSALLQLNDNHERIGWHEFSRFKTTRNNMQRMFAYNTTTASASAPSVFVMNQGQKLQVRRLTSDDAQSETRDDDPSELIWEIEVDDEFPSIEEIKSLEGQVSARIVNYSEAPFSSRPTQWWNLQNLALIEPRGDSFDQTHWDPTRTRRLLLTPIDESPESHSNVRRFSEKWKLRIESSDATANASPIEHEFAFPFPASALPVWTADGKRLAIIPAQGIGSSWFNYFVLAIDCETGKKLIQDGLYIPDAQAQRNRLLIGGPIVAPRPLASWSPNGRFLAWLDQWGETRILDADRNKTIATIDSPLSNSNSASNPRAINSDRESTRNRSGRVMGKALGVFWSPDGNQLLIATEDPVQRGFRFSIGNTQEIGEEPSRVIQGAQGFASLTTAGNFLLGVHPDWEHGRIALVSSKQVQVYDLATTASLASRITADGIGTGWLEDGSLAYVAEAENGDWTLCKLDPTTDNSKTVSLPRFQTATLRVHKQTNRIYLATNLGLFEFDDALTWKQTWWMTGASLDRLGPSLLASGFGGDVNRYRVIRETESGSQTLTLDAWRELRESEAQ